MLRFGDLLATEEVKAPVIYRSCGSDMLAASESNLSKKNWNAMQQ